MDGTEYLVEAEALLHRQYEFRQQIAGMRPDNGDSQNSIFSGDSQKLDKPMRRFIGNRTIEVSKIVACHFMSNALFFCLLLR